MCVDLSNEAKVKDAATTFTWKDNAGNIVIPTIAEHGRFAFGKEFVGKTLFCELANSRYPGGTLFTVDVNISGSGFDKDFGENRMLVVYPNPTTDFLKVAVDDVIREYRIIAVAGNLIKTAPVGDFRATIDVQNLKPGVYLLEIICTKSVSRTKFMKM